MLVCLLQETGVGVVISSSIAFIYLSFLVALTHYISNLFVFCINVCTCTTIDSFSVSDIAVSPNNNVCSVMVVIGLMLLKRFVRSLSYKGHVKK